jgi:hypothetical protein
LAGLEDRDDPLSCSTSERISSIGRAPVAQLAVELELAGFVLDSRP